MSIKQLNGTYLPNDDRIIFRFNTIDNNECKFWFTRRITHFILQSANQFFVKQQEERHKTDPSIAKVISDFQQQAVKDTTDLSNPYVPGTQYPMGADPILVIDARCELLKDEEVFSLDLLLPAGANLNLKLPIPTMRGLVLLLEQLNTQAMWGEFTTRAQQPLSPEGRDNMH